MLNRRPTNWPARLLLALFGIGLAGGMFLLLLALFPALRLRLDPNAISYTAGMGDLFVHQPGWIAPPPDPDAVLSLHHYAVDADGFRVPAWQAAVYPVVALGDSFTEAVNVARPWPDALAALLGQPVRNLGFRGYGPVQQARMLELYGQTPEIVVLAFFEGNDLSNAVSIQWETGGEVILPNAARADLPPVDPQAWQSGYTGPFKYPVDVILSERTEPMAFLEAYLWWLNGDESVFRESRSGEVLAQSWQQMQSAAPGACLLVAYLPTKAHIYAPYIAEADRARVIESAEQVVRLPDGVLRTLPERELVESGDLDALRSFEDILARLDNQRDAVRTLAAESGVAFVDLVPAFRLAAAAGDVLYYTYDTHWNQAGHDLAAGVIAEAITGGVCER